MTDDDESEGRRELSWIWVTTRSVPVDRDEFEIAEGVLISFFNHSYLYLATTPGMRVEWAKTHVRANHWREEVLLVREEMRRVVSFLDWKATWWRLQGQRRSDVRDDIRHGLAAYANRQGHLMQHLAETFAAMWYPMLTAAGLPIEWPAHYVSYAQAHPPTFRVPRRKAASNIPADTNDDGESGSESDDEDGGYDSAEGDDLDVSPYK